MQYKTLTYKKQDKIATLELNNPPGNVMTIEFFNELLDVCENEIAKEDFSGLIISAAGRHFSSGANVEELTEVIKKSTQKIPESMQKNLKSIEILYKISKPKVAILKGICFGSGLELALTADYRIAQKNTVISLPEVSFDLMPGLGGVGSLARIVGDGKALELILSGESINADDALRLEIVNVIADKEQLMDVAVEYISFL